MKKWILPLVATILIVISFLTYSAKPYDVIFGEGNEENFKVASLHELTSVFDFIINRKFGVSSITNTNESVLLADNTQNAFSDTETTVHHSVTLTETTTMQEIEYLKNNVRKQITFQRTLTIYLTKTASYYISKGSMETKYSASHSDLITQEDECSYFDIEIYMDGQITLLKFNELIDTHGNIIVDEWTNRWLQVPEELAQAFILSLDEMNRVGLAALKRYIEEEKEAIYDGRDGRFKKDGDVYTRIDNLLGANSGTFVVDLSNAQTPYIELNIVSSSQGSLEGGIYIYDFVSFSNIDNTIIDFNIKDFYYIDDIEDLFTRGV